MHIIIRWIISALAIGIAAYLLPGVEVTGITAALLAALILGLLNVFIKPFLVLLALPINIMTLGLFTLVINALLIMLASSVVPGFHVSGFLWAVVFSLVLSILNMILDSWNKN